MEMEIEMKRLTTGTNRVETAGRKPPAPTCGISGICMVEVTGKISLCSEQDSGCTVLERTKAKNLARCGVHRRFADCTFANIARAGVPANIREQYNRVLNYAQNLAENISNGRGLLLKGAVGTMKTSLAVAVLQEQIAAGGGGYFITMSALLDNIFTLKAISPGKWAQFEQQLRETPLLVLDDLGSEHTEGWVLTKVDAIIAERYNRCLPLIITTNLTAGQLRGVYAERVIDRLRATLQVINFQGPSLRPPG